MGTRYEDQPPELWAGPESLDPTPVWKQFALVGLFLFLGLVLVGVVAAFAVAPQLVTPPALVPGGRLVLPLSALPTYVGGAGAPPDRGGPPLVDGAPGFLLAPLIPTGVLTVPAPGSAQPCPGGCPIREAIV